MNNQVIATELLKVAERIEENEALYESIIELAENIYSKWPGEYSYWREQGYRDYNRDIEKGINTIARAYGAKKRDIFPLLTWELSELAD